MKAPLLNEVFETLHETLGPQHWWPADTPCEMAVGAVLVQNTGWENAARAIACLRDHEALSWAALHAVPEGTLAEWIRPSGTYQVKARRLKALVRVVIEEGKGSLDGLFAEGLDAARAQLLAVPGIGPETADCILLYAGSFPVFVVDAYTRRIASRHGWCEDPVSYDTLARLFTDQLPADSALYNEYHALMVAVGKRWCRKYPECETCPLCAYLPEAQTNHEPSP